MEGISLEQERREEKEGAKENKLEGREEREGGEEREETIE